MSFMETVSAGSVASHGGECVCVSVCVCWMLLSNQNFELK